MNLPISIYHLPFISSSSDLKIEKSGYRWKMKDGKWKIQTGQSLFEVVVAIGISALIITAVVALVTNSISNSAYSRNQSAADSYAQQLVEWLRGQRGADIQVFLNNIDPNLGGSNVYCFEDLTWTTPTKRVQCTAGQDVIPGTIFWRQANFTNVSPPTGQTVFNAEISVTWNDSKGDHKIIVSTDFGDLRQR